MPIYEYYCSKCKSEFELLIRSGQKPVCPDCGSGKLQRQMSATASHIGSGVQECPGTGMPCGDRSSSCCSGCVNHAH